MQKIKLYDKMSLERTVTNIKDKLTQSNISIYGGLIREDYIFEHEFDTDSFNLMMTIDRYNNLISGK